MGIRVASRCASLLLLAFCSVGCFGPHRYWPDDLVWSPDGRRAAVLGQDLYLTDTSGNLTPLHTPGVYRAAWLGDSQRLVLARARPVTTFAEISAAIGPERTRAITRHAEYVWWQLQGPEWPEYESDAILVDADAVAVYLRDRHGEELQQKFQEIWKSVEGVTVSLHAIVVAQPVGDRLTSVRVLHEDITPVKTIRPAPGDRAIAYVTRDEAFVADPTARTYVVPTDGSARAALVAEDTGEFADWTRDGRSLVYFNASGAGDPNIGIFGSLSRREVLDGAGQVRLEERPSEIVDAFFERDSGVWSLRDGRVLFDVSDIRFPRSSRTTMEILKDGRPTSIVVGRGRGVRCLFAFDPAQVDAAPVNLVAAERLAEDAVGVYEVSPDRAKLIYSTWKGRMRLLTLADGRTETLPLGLENESGYVWGELPRVAWSGSDTFTYMKPVNGRSELILRRGETETVLSRHWPADLLGPLRKR